MANNIEGCISLGPWGDANEGEPWSYLPTPNGSLTQIVIRHGGAIDSLVFQSVNHETGSIEYSAKFGGPGGNRTDKVCIDGSVEHLKAMEITLGYYASKMSVLSLTLQTNVAEYGPFGNKSGTSVSIPIQGGAIVGFHGRSGTCINSIGVYAMPKRFISTPADQTYDVLLRSTNALKLSLPRDPGPWGGIEGKKWDDGVFARVEKVGFYLGPRRLHGIQFKYQKMDGKVVWSPIRGSKKNSTDFVTFDGSGDEELTGIEGYYGSWTEDDNVVEGIKSITLYSNKTKYGPYGDENGTYFISSLTGGKIVGFCGRSGANLNAIGVHMLYD